MWEVREDFFFWAAAGLSIFAFACGAIVAVRAICGVSHPILFLMSIVVIIVSIVAIVSVKGYAEYRTNDSIVHLFSDQKSF